MQTFLPLPSFSRSAAVLDRQRLGKQRIECIQLVRALTLPGAGWANHPAAKMWAGYVPALAAYGVAVCDAWIARGYRDTCRAQLLPLSDRDGPRPPWFGRPDFHLAHRSNLVRKAPDHYGPLWPDVAGDLPYVWG